MQLIYDDIECESSNTIQISNYDKILFSKFFHFKKIHMVNDMIRPSVPNQNMGYLWGFGFLNFLIQCYFLVASEPEKSPIF